MGIFHELRLFLSDPKAAHITNTVPPTKHLSW